MTEDAAAVSRRVLSRMRINPRFGNAGDVENLLYQAKDPNKFTIEPGDIDPDWDRPLRADESRAKLFEGFVGFNKIIERFEGYKHLVDGLRLHDIDSRPHIPWAFILKGPPGTGKTPTAQKVGRLYRNMGLLSTEEVVTCAVSDFVGQWVGHTGPKVIKTLETGLGKVLFIDEAYRFANDYSPGSSDYHADAIGELVDAMSQLRYKNNMVVILAGYTAEMESLLQMNPGLRSRFPEQIVFQPMGSRACLQHLESEIQKLNISIVGLEDTDKEKSKTVHRLFKKLGRTGGWANSRDVETLAKTIIGNVYMLQGLENKKKAMGSLQVTVDEVIEVQKGC
ncbi:hypothetical protein CSAL01_10851 [Colletotrichum salicis]|uniref:ATPase AAA-type core domain-containing protein n=1 Tax=Colletotrichum salicis TaxID=1209931 RepID=A0A135USN2_9PEZI|nr:hypothetical protein CSAL01_10851 [Colletotrichum salicis]